jgi:hypothetical protein
MKNLALSISHNDDMKKVR